MAFRNKRMTMPSIDDIIMQIMAMSESLYDGDWTIGWQTYDTHRPPNWPTARYLLKFYGYDSTSAGWAGMVAMYIGVDCKPFTEIMRGNAECRMEKRWRVEGKPEYTAKPDEHYLAATYGAGLFVCQATYERTGRMVLR